MNTLDRSKGAFLGLAVGDAMGAPVEFSSPGNFQPVTEYRSGGPFNLPAGYWTDDTSMALCLAESLIHNQGDLSLEDQMTRYYNWYRYGRNSSTGVCFDIGNGTAIALENFSVNGVNLGPARNEGNGSLMRLSPIPIAYLNYAEPAVRLACYHSSMATHNEFASTLAGEFGVLVHKALTGAEKGELHTEIVSYDQKSTIGNSGHAPQSLAAALYHFHSTDSFEEAVLQAVNFGGDSDTIAAITGQLAGAFYGIQGIPQDWKEGLHESERLLDVAQALHCISFS